MPAGLFVVLLLCLIGPVWYCDHLVGDKAARCFAFCWFLMCKLSFLGCLRFFLTSLADYVLSLWLLHDIWAASSKKCLRTCAKWADSDHCAHAKNIIRAIALHSYILHYPMALYAISEGPGHTARMHRLICASGVRICLKTCFCVA